MKILVLGLPRTGTQSLADALSQLGVSPIYHMREVSKNGHQMLWIQAFESKFEGKGRKWERQDFEQILAGFEGLADFPAAAFPEELISAYPEAAIIQTVRSEDSWYDSMMSTLWHQHSKRTASSDASPMVPLAIKYHTLCWGNDFPVHGREYFREHSATVKQLSRGRKFLEYHVKDGWGPLCAFLGVEVPDEPFPRADHWFEYKNEVKRQQQRGVDV